LIILIKLWLIGMEPVVRIPNQPFLAIDVFSANNNTYKIQQFT